MRITDVRTCGLRGATLPGGRSNELEPDDVVHTLIAVHADDGHVGVGSVSSIEALVRAALDLFKPLLVGECALAPERITEKLHQSSFWRGRGGAVTHMISGIDIALWDLMGQALDQPVGRLLGGRHRQSVLPYASVLFEDCETLTDGLRCLAQLGFRAFKIGWGHFGRIDQRTDEGIVACARSAIGDR
ncbi:hypothetical protein ACRAWC_08825 [Leifsonia sp. L25]|uniref:hypothetical protein n=1 Tax=Actinomycetes TaxID=1760 RepID=UPI003D68F034